MAWLKGWNFRSTAGFVTDGADTTYEIADANYPVTRNGVTFGWDDIVIVDKRDRNNSVDARFAGLNFQGNPALITTFRVDLPAVGDYRINASFGDHDNPQTVYAIFKDNATGFSTINSVATGGANQYLDATGTNRSSPTDWINNNAALTRTFGSTIFRLTLGDGVSAQGYVTHLFLTQLGGSPLLLLPLQRPIARLISWARPGGGMQSHMFVWVSRAAAGGVYIPTFRPRRR